MTEPARTRIDISSGTFLRALLFVALAWAWLRLWQWVLLFVVAAILAVALDPLVIWLERRRIRRGFGAPLVMLVLTGVLVGFFWLAGASLSDQAKMVGGRIQEARQQFIEKVPQGVRDMLPLGDGQQAQQGRESGSQEGSGGASGGSAAVRAGRALVSGILSLFIALILTVYLLIDGRRTYEWFVAFAPRGHRDKVRQTAREARAAFIGYMRGNIATSVLAAIFTFVVLSLLKVPAALLLALLAGILNFVPVIGLLLSLAPAVLLALTVSPTTAALVAAFYLGYNAVESYYIQPRVYGHEMRLSSLAVLAAFAAGAELGGVIGALIALPIAAMYPAFESIWLRGKLDPASVDDHRRIEKTEEH